MEGRRLTSAYLLVIAVEKPDPFIRSLLMRGENKVIFLRHGLQCIKSVFDPITVRLQKERSTSQQHRHNPILNYQKLKGRMSLKERKPLIAIVAQMQT